MKDVFVPLFSTPQLEATQAFYERHFGFRVAVELPGYVELQYGETGPKLGFMTPQDEIGPAASGQGLIYCFQVDDADAEHARLLGEGVAILQAPEDKPWGERGFVAADPNGISLWIGHLLPNAVESAASAE